MGNRQVVVTICVGDAFKKMAEVTHPTIKAYAEKCGADFLVLSDNTTGHHAGFMKFQLGKLFDTYDRVLYVDTDILIRDDSPSLFEKIPAGVFAAFNEGAYMERFSNIESFVSEYPVCEHGTAKAWARSGIYYNTGVMMLDKKFADFFVIPQKPINHFYEQTQFNFELFKYAVKNGEKLTICDLNYKFNRMSHMDKRTGESRLDSYFLHYAGALGRDGTREGVIEIMQSDLHKWNNLPRVYPKQIFIQSGGGIGDVVASEPAVRFAAEKMYPKDQIVLQTAHPELFAHLPENVKIIPTNMTIQDQGHYEIHLMPTAEKIINAFVTHLLMHPLDYASLMLMKGQLPISDRQICLLGSGLNDETINALRGCVLIHAGKGWPSKTFPASWWKDTVDQIRSSGFKVALIGKHGDYHSIVDFEAEVDLDLRDQLTLSQLIQAIQVAPVLISNDSLPVHIAGSGNNWIGLLATCKHPDRILPWRNGSQRHKASVLTKKIIQREFRPNHPDIVTVDEATADEVMACLPKPEQIVDWLKKIPVEFV